jgi:alkanesulfonate monooxygenase SsuD/methylene tetrahydromethanopterin reductase-like flavin-dependent oxidoreductase (luciferase family)
MRHQTEQTMKFGIFDHLDRNELPMAQYYEERLKLVELYDRTDFHAYHVAEHHSTPLGMAPSPSVFLSAVAQRTRRLRFGPLVYILPLYHPLRVAEEVCMLDHLSNGRLQLGVGRGVSPFELGYFGVDAAEAPGIYFESFEVLIKALTQDVLDHEGQRFQFRNVPIVLRPLQQPHPPLWYGVGAPEGVDWCVANRVNAVVNGPLERVRAIVDRYAARWAEAGHAPQDMPFVGTTRHIVVAETDEQARKIAEPAYLQWYNSFMKLWLQHGSAPQLAMFPTNLAQAQQAGVALVGSPATVREMLAEQVERSGANYMLCRFAFGTVTLAEATQSVELFHREVMPGFTTDSA